MHSSPKAAPTNLAATTLLIITIILTITLPASGRILNVPDDHQTIQAGINAAEEGDTVLVAPGVYEENLIIGDSSIVLGSELLIRDDEAIIEATILDGGGDGTVINIRGQRSATEVRGFTIRNGLSNEVHGGGISIGSLQPVLLQDLFITENQGGAGSAAYALGQSQVLFRRVIIQRNTSRSSILDGDTGGSWSMEDCQIIGNETSGQIFYGAYRDVSFLRVVVADNISSYQIDLVGWIDMFGAIQYRFDHLTLLVPQQDNDENPFALRIRAQESTEVSLMLSNSIIRGPGNRLVSLTEDDRGSLICEVDHADLTGGRDAVITSGGLEFNWGDGNFDADPLFLDPDNGDYSLSPDSPCIDAGDPESPLDQDGTRADMGAFYFHQRDIEQSTSEIVFEQMPFGEVDSQSVIITNFGGTPLTISIIDEIVNSSIYARESGQGEIIIQPVDNYRLNIIYQPREHAFPANIFRILSNDPDEPVLTIHTWESLAAPSDPLTPFTFHLSPPYPNPFNSSTTIRFRAGSQAASTRLSVYDLSGRLVADLFDAHTLPPSHSHTLIWNADGLPGGIYLVRLEAGAEARTQKVVLMK